MSWLDGLLMTCKHFNVDYYNASEKDRAFVEAVVRKNYGLKQAQANEKAASTVLWNPPCWLNTSGSPAVDNSPPPTSSQTA